MTGRTPEGRVPHAVDRDRRRFLRHVAGLGIAAWVGPLWMASRTQAGVGAGAYPWPETARSWRAMGTLLEVRVPDLPPAAAVEAVGRVRRSVEALEAAMTLFRQESPLVALNGAAPGRWVPVPEPLAHALRAAARAAEITGGAYDPTVARALRAWGLYDDAAEPGHPPDAAWMRRAGVAALEVEAGRARRHDPATEIDLGGIGKGIAVDAALAELARAGSEAALVNLGGSIGVLGAPRDSERGWPVGIVHPDRPGEIWTTGWLRSGHLATSGDYERWVETPRGRVHHLIDPRSGEPARGVASVTVWSPTGEDADVASTAFFVRQARGERPAERPHLTLCRGIGGLAETRVGGSPGDAMCFDLEIG